MRALFRGRRHILSLGDDGRTSEIMGGAARCVLELTLAIGVVLVVSGKAVNNIGFNDELIIQSDRLAGLGGFRSRVRRERREHAARRLRS